MTTRMNPVGTNQLGQDQDDAGGNQDVGKGNRVHVTPAWRAGLNQGGLNPQWVGTRPLPRGRPTAAAAESAVAGGYLGPSRHAP